MENSTRGSFSGDERLTFSTPFSGMSFSRSMLLRFCPNTGIEGRITGETAVQKEKGVECRRRRREMVSLETNLTVKKWSVNGNVHQIGGFEN
jgi:hypothetical protein